MEIKVRVEHLALGDVADSALKSTRTSLDFSLEGVVGDRHAGFVKNADGRDKGVVRGTLIRNWRQWSAVSAEELQRIAEALRIERLDPNLLGANLTFSGCDDLTHVPKGSAIWFEGGVVLTVEGENNPCVGPGKEIAKCIPAVDAEEFPKAAKNLRGVVGVVYRAGTIALGETAIIQTYEPYRALPKPPSGFMSS